MGFCTRDSFSNLQKSKRKSSCNCTTTFSGIPQDVQQVVNNLCFQRLAVVLVCTGGIYDQRADGESHPDAGLSNRRRLGLGCRDYVFLRPNEA